MPKIIYIKLLKLESSFETNYAQVLEDNSLHNLIMFYFFNSHKFTWLNLSFKSPLELLTHKNKKHK